MFTLEESRQILKALPSMFDSHDFIRMGALIASPSFLDLLKEYSANFQTIDSQIGQFLNRQSNDLSISKIGEHESETIIGTNSKCALWKK